MSSPSDQHSQVSAASILGSSVPVCELCGFASRTSSAEPSLPSIGQESLVSPTCAPLWASPKATDADRGGRGDLIQQVRGNSSPTGHYACPCRCHTSTSSVPAGPAPASPSPDGERGSTTRARVFGSRSSDSFATFDPDTWCWRTSQLCLGGDLDVFSETWPRWGTTQSGVAYAPQMSEPRTAVTDSGSWGTPTARDWKDTGDMTNVPENGLLGRQALNRWAAPTTADGSGGPGSSGRAGGENLRTQAGGSLSPEFVEWLMGFPLGWTEL